MTVPRRPILVAPDAFKEMAAARRVAEAIGRGLGRAGWECDIAPIADGGEGQRPCWWSGSAEWSGRAWVHDPLGREIEASFALLGMGVR